MRDVQSTPDTRGIDIQRVGLKGVHLPFQILTMAGAYQQAVAHDLADVLDETDALGIVARQRVEILKKSSMGGNFHGNHRNRAAP